MGSKASDFGAGPEVEGEQVVELQASGVAMDSYTRSEIMQMAEWAQTHKRSIEGFRKSALEHVTLNARVASECFYVLPRRERDGSSKNIEGPSARLAEIIGTTWGNCRYGARIVGEVGDFVVAQGAFHDLQSNTHVSFEVRRRITDRNGKRYNADMIGVTANAAASIALRNAVFKGIPKALWAEVYEAARKVVRGDERTLEGRRTAALAHFASLGVDAARVCAALGVPGVKDIGLDQLETLTGIRTAIEDGDTTAESAFAPQAPSDVEHERTVRIQGLAVKLGFRTVDLPPLFAEWSGRLDGLEKMLAAKLAAQAEQPQEKNAAPSPEEPEAPAPEAAAAAQAVPAQPQATMKWRY